MVVQAPKVRQGLARCAICSVESDTTLRHKSEKLANETAAQKQARLQQMSDYQAARETSTPFCSLRPRAQARPHDDHHLPSIIIGGIFATSPDPSC